MQVALRLLPLSGRYSDSVESWEKGQRHRAFLPTRPCWASLSLNSLSTVHTQCQPFQPPLVFGGGNPWPERPLSPPPLRFRASSLALSPAAGSRDRWRRRWKRCAVAEGGRTPPYGDSTPTILGEPRDFSDSGVGLLGGVAVPFRWFRIWHTFLVLGFLSLPASSLLRNARSRELKV
jgi:hypothetical protein